ncbi:MAG: hypothetical protein HOK61_01920 [Alphaproteobacteria bacterium]|jgi:hypothetical protein|nr:hypothetical protein [Alphaproteobacteria bacterium]
MTQALTAARLVEQCQARLKAARHATENGMIVQLDGLQTAIAEIQSAAQTAPEEDRATLRQQLISLLSDVDLLEQDMILERDNTAIELKKMSAGKRAVNAYGAAPKTHR